MESIHECLEQCNDVSEEDYIVNARFVFPKSQIVNSDTGRVYPPGTVLLSIMSHEDTENVGTLTIEPGLLNTRPC